MVALKTKKEFMDEFNSLINTEIEQSSLELAELEKYVVKMMNNCFGKVYDFKLDKHGKLELISVK